MPYNDVGVRLYRELFAGGLMSYLRYLCLFAFYSVFLRLVYSMVPVSLACPFLIAFSVFSNVYLTRTST
jgi:hypothetical protein